MIKKCNCTHYLGNEKAAKYQDKKYGKGMRVFTHGDTPHCTVCGQTFTETIRKKK